MKMFNDIACNLNSNLIKWDAKNIESFAPNYGVEKIILKRHFSLLFIYEYLNKFQFGIVQRRTCKT
jgi:hypothetical protein